MLIIIFIVSSIVESKDTIFVAKTTFCRVDMFIFFSNIIKKIDSSSFDNTHRTAKKYG